MTALRQYLNVLGFSPKSGATSMWIKSYKNHGGYEIVIDLKDPSENSRIDWGNKIKSDRSTTANFSQVETRVVLECVDRLLGQGYNPKSIVLEKKWKLGLKGKGFLDIQVLDGRNKSFLMIECKTADKEYDKAWQDTERDGGQLFSYFVQEKTTKYLVLYTSFIENGGIKHKNNIVVVNGAMQRAENQQEAFEAWHPQVSETKGLFESESLPYEIQFTGLIKVDLQDLTEKDGGDIFNRFAEILRKNVVSDKTNAFNKIFNLFLCKIVDEFNTGEDEALKFQWGAEESDKDAMLRLNDLYKQGMDLYLHLKIEAVSQKELDEVLKVQNNEKIRELFIRQKLYSGNEFAFKEVFDKASFEKNCAVVKEVVNLIQKYRIRYETKQQFLGDFFENLLNTGIKQEAGQFFTPIPLAQFICKSIPIRAIIEEKNNQKDPFVLPYVIDYASGAGHFLTEVMEEIDHYVGDINKSWLKCGEKHKRDFMKSKDNFDWAGEYVYGIEKDYRLAKTTKISTFLNGDGDANIICSDGIGHFIKTPEYNGRLSELKDKENRQFDMLVANPPYSVDGFKTTMEHGKESFDLFQHLTDQSSEIECLFIERAKQLLRDGGMAGIILPITILTNGKLHARAREIILKYFEIKAIVELDGNAFMATGTKTATLFLKRRKNSEWQVVQRVVDDFFANFRDVACSDYESIFSTYAATVYNGLKFADYVSLFSATPTKAMQAHEIYLDYAKEFETLSADKQLEKIIETEKEKLFYFILTYDQTIVIVKSPTANDAGKEFLGYKFSNAKGREGIEFFRDIEGKIDTKLFHEDLERLYSDKKINSYILRNFKNENIPEPSDEVKEFLQVQKLHESLDFDRIVFEKRITTQFGKKKAQITSKWEMAKLGSICEFQSGLWKGKRTPFYGIKVLRNTEFKSDGYLDFSKVPLIQVEKRQLEDRKLKYGDILLEKSGGSPKQAIGRVTFFNQKEENEFAFGNFIARLRPISNNLNAKYLWIILKNFYYKGGTIALQNGLRILNLDMTGYKNTKIPLPPFGIQQKIVAETEKIEKKELKISKELKQGESEIEKIITENLLSNEDYPKEKLKNVLEINPSKPKFSDEDVFVSFLPMEAVSNEGGILKLAKRKIKDVKKGYVYFQEGDVLFAKITPCMENGKGAIAENLLNGIGFGSTEFYVLRSSENIINRLVHHLIQLEEFRKMAEKNMTGLSGHRRVAKNFIEGYQISLPSLPEQQKIVAQLETVEVRQAKLKQELVGLKEQKQTVLLRYLN